MGRLDYRAPDAFYHRVPPAEPSLHTDSFTIHRNIRKHRVNLLSSLLRP